MAEFGAAAEDQPLAIGRHAVIGEHPARIGEGPVFRADRTAKLRRQLLGGNDVGTDGNDTALELRRHVPGVAIGGDDDVARLNDPARGFHLPAIAGLGELRHRRFGRNANAALGAEIEQALEIQGGVQVCGAAHHHAAAIVIRPNLLALPFRRHEIGFGLGVFVERVDLLGHAVEVAFAPGAEEIAGTGPAAVDLFPGNQVFDQPESIGGIGQIRRGFLRAHGLGHIALADIDAARHHAAIPRRCAKARLIGIEHDAVKTFARQLQRGGKPGIARADDGDAGLLRQWNFWQRLRFMGLPPERAGFEILVEDCGRHGGSLAGDALLIQHGFGFR